MFFVSNTYIFTGKFEEYLAKIPADRPYEEFILDEITAIADFIFADFTFNETFVDELNEDYLTRQIKKNAF